MAVRVTAVIPARLGSRRFPGKVLYPYRGKPLLYYVWNDVRRSKRIDRLIVATDTAEVAKAAEMFGAEVFRSTKPHATGTDRVAEVVARVGGDICLNIQADNFGLTGHLLDRNIASFERERKIAYGTMAMRIKVESDLFNPNTVKVVVSKDDMALWFSRYPIPFLQHPDVSARTGQFPFRKHIGVYLFRRSGLENFRRWKQSRLEKAESLEQLRILEHGARMKVYDVPLKTVSVDSPADVEKLDRLYI
ncbi:3-deoxy-manno-octulosonate cytidylyltransferase [candidate division GN15 bacterium]|uniref:3-deoxy-manno-octulosonate cytidylyltransferase n=1 Tax=candidate division GN15 bacterium TaxID=2072418 RepID=A0A855X4Q0_9BACT|nr:MAG: 3-deoxy-manno-octulosonate cytidylyltransferase [candidate division GN15 bacterium]